jgi:hypothetical protein
MNNPEAFAETYWSINSLRVYNESGKPAKSSSLSGGAIAGIVIGSLVGIALIVFLVWRWRKRRQNRRISIGGDEGEVVFDENRGNTPKPYSFLATGGANIPALSGNSSASSSRSNSRKGKTFGINMIPKNPKGNIQANGYAREGKTKLAPGKSAQHYLAGETPLAPKINDEDGFTRRGSAASGPKAFQGGGDWVALASGSRRGSAAPSVGGQGGSRRASAAPSAGKGWVG